MISKVSIIKIIYITMTLVLVTSLSFLNEEFYGAQGPFSGSYLE